jgi:regulator of protease activity HflC (stomatin/prohibitin superfamily)
MPIQSQGIITDDNVSVDVSAVDYFRVVDAVKSVVAIENVGTAIDQIAQTTLRKVVGQHTLDQTLSAAALGQASDIMAAASPPPFITAGPIPPPTAAANGTDAS